MNGISEMKNTGKEYDTVAVIDAGAQFAKVRVFDHAVPLFYLVH